jgi:hypothetical protein
MIYPSDENYFTMNARELRIGNLVKVNGVEYYIYCIHSPMEMKDESFSHKYFVDLLNYGIVSHLESDIEPIPLTEEWLERFGFVQNKVDWYWIKDGFKLPNKQTITIVDTTAVMCPWSNREIKYVHSLQNLYFALTGEELELKK